MRLIGRLLLLAVLLLGSSAFALGFSVRGALRFDGKFGLEGEVEYADRLDAKITWGVRASLRAIPLSDPLILIVPGGFIEYRQTLLDDKTTVSGYGKAELGVGLLPQFFPRLVLTGGLDGRTPIAEDLDGFAQVSTYFDFIVTNRAKLGLTGRVGAILIPFVPYVAFDLNYDFYPATVGSNIYAGTLLYLSPQFFLGLEAGFDPGGYVRLFFQWSER